MPKKNASKSLTRELLIESLNIEVIETLVGDVVMYVKPMSELKRSTRASQMFTSNGDIDPKFMAKRRIYTIIDHLCDKDGEMLFTERDIKLLLDLDGKKLDAYFVAVSNAIGEFEGNE